MRELEGKVALVTGAGGGIGSAICRLFSEYGAIVIPTARDVGPLSDFSEFLDASPLKLDVSSPADWAHVADSVLDKFGRLDILVNNAGIMIVGTISDMSVESFSRSWEVNVLGAFLGIQTMLPALKRSTCAAVVNVSSGAAMAGFPDHIAYGTSKWGLRGLTKCAARDLAPFRIRVNSIHPGIVDTDMVTRLGLSADDPEVRQTLGRLPIPRFGRPEEVASMAAFLASDRSSYCTGAEFVADGGLLGCPMP